MQNNNIRGPKRPFIAKPSTNSDWKVSVEVSNTETRDFLIKNCRLSNLFHEISEDNKIDEKNIISIIKVKM